jgi:hypothetical protein
MPALANTPLALRRADSASICESPVAWKSSQNNDWMNGSWSSSGRVERT